MYSWRGRRRSGGQRSRARGCLLLVLLVIVVLIVLSVMFGGFQKGTKSPRAAPPLTTAQFTG
jgi:ABC-type lipoprotein release transport system permease subunit